MSKQIRTLKSVIIFGNDVKEPVIADVVSYSLLEINGIVHRCLVAVSAEGGVWIYPEKKLYADLEQEVYVRLNGVEYENYLEMQDYAEARYPQPDAAALRQFFHRFRAEFLPLRSITIPAPKPVPAFASNAEQAGFFIVSPS